MLMPATPVTFALRWLLDHGGPAVQYRSLVEVARLSGRFDVLPYSHHPALLLALQQGTDGSWGHSMLGIPTARSAVFEGVGTINAVRRLLEYGWDPESPPIVHARRLLFRLLAEDDDPAFLFEFGGKGKADEFMSRRARGILREAAAAALAQAGYENDPRLRGCARRSLERVVGYLRSPLGQKPWVRVGNKQVLAADAHPPSIYTLLLLAHMPVFRSEHSDLIERLFQHLSQPLPRQEPVQLCGEQLVPQPHLVLGDMLPNRNAADADVPSALFWLELMARLGYLRRSESWNKLFDRFLDARDRDGVWRPHRGVTVPSRTTNPFLWPSFPLGDGSSEDERSAEVTFRLGLIARLSGRPVEAI
ncbi:MAG TPA: hypothetical protein VKA84_28170 [Gemmatimonadaceae bacterium]|nr:hypothetical protein [Gemmatimonadaceae bacterium]